ncbi:tyrosine-type recombinase/integrase [Bacillus atrophaeus]|uniref:tyrosine-type recombinase/integrase n=1 Tax=Bacillus atrophaeus TaxID=1452 RepID=UPI000B45543B|nr:site-specific integrase [Bacillus atrophaeus]ARW09097.1 ICEBs1 integrase [Bacillus atrophaeus]
MPIKKLSNGKYRIDVSIGFDPITGKRRRKTKIATTKSQAEDIYYSIKRKYKDGLIPSNKEVKFNELTKIYLDHIKLNLKRSTFDTRNTIVKYHINPYFKDSSIKKITHREIIDFRKTLINKNLKESTINSIITILQTMFSLAINEEYIKSNPCDKVKKIKFEKDEMNFWTPQQFELFTKLLSPEQFFYKTIYTFAYLTGARLGEILALKWSDLDIITNQVKINKTYHRKNKEDIFTPPKTVNSNRTISINPKLVEILNNWNIIQAEEYQKLGMEHSKDTRMFKRKGRIPTPKTLNRIIQDTCQKFNNSETLPSIRFHDLRHSHVALLINTGEEVLLISERLGHHSVAYTLDTYGHLFPNRQKEMANRLDKLSFY